MPTVGRPAGGKSKVGLSRCNSGLLKGTGGYNVSVNSSIKRTDCYEFCI